MQSIPTAQSIPRHPPSRAGETRFPTSPARNRLATPESPSARAISAPPRLRVNKSLLLAPTHPRTNAIARPVRLQPRQKQTTRSIDTNLNRGAAISLRRHSPGQGTIPCYSRKGTNSLLIPPRTGKSARSGISIGRSPRQSLCRPSRAAFGSRSTELRNEFGTAASPHRVVREPDRSHRIGRSCAGAGRRGGSGRAGRPGGGAAGEAGNARARQPAGPLPRSHCHAAARPGSGSRHPRRSGTPARVRHPAARPVGPPFPIRARTGHPCGRGSMSDGAPAQPF